MSLPEGGFNATEGDHDLVGVDYELEGDAIALTGDGANVAVGNDMDEADASDGDFDVSLSRSSSPDSLIEAEQQAFGK